MRRRVCDPELLPQLQYNPLTVKRRRERDVEVREPPASQLSRVDYGLTSCVYIGILLTQRDLQAGSEHR